MRVLVVGKDAASAGQLARSVASCPGCQVEVTSNLETVFHRLAVGDVALLVADWRLPDMPATDLSAHIRNAEIPRQPAILLVHDAEDPVDIAVAQRTGADEVLRAPVDPGELQIRIRSIGRLVDLDQEVDRRVTDRIVQLSTANQTIRPMPRQAARAILSCRRGA